MGLKCQLVKDWFLLNFMDFSIISNISLALPLSPGFIVSPSFLHWLPDLFCRRGYCYFLLHLKKKLVRGCIILIYAGFLQTKVSVYVGVYFPSLGFFSLHLFFFFFGPPQWEAWWTQKCPMPFSFCSFLSTGLEWMYECMHACACV